MRYEKNFFLILTLIFSFLVSTLESHNVGLLVVATGKYINFVKPLVESARKYFCPGHQITFFIFTDQTYQTEADTIVLPHKRYGWPYDTLFRYIAYFDHKDTLKTMDYLFACDADMLFVNRVGDEILGELVATQHPGFIGKRGTYETRELSQAYIAPHEGECYFAGGFYGGKTDEFFTMIQAVLSMAHTDLKNGIIATWHDESYNNRYFIDHKPTIILSPSYCYPESWSLPYTKRLLALDKNHSQIRK